MAKSKVGKILGAVAGVAVIAGVAFGLYKAGVFGGNDKPPVNENQLAQVTNVNFNEESSLLTWNEVPNADSYEIKIDGKLLNEKVDTNSFNYNVVNDSTVFAVRACDSTYTYTSGDWSTDYTYTIQAQDSLSVAQVNTFANNLMESYQLENVVGIAINDENPKMLNVYANYTQSGKSVLKEINVFYNSNITSLESAINGYSNRAEQTSSSFRNVTYDSANAYLQRTELDGTLQQYREDGYTLSVVTSQTAKTSTYSGNIFATIKASKGNETKYFVTNVCFDVFDASAIEKNNFTTKISDGDANLTENFCFECTGDFAEYAKNVDKVASSSLQTSMAYNPSSNKENDGMEY